MVYDGPPEVVDQSAWNLSQADILLMSELWRKATTESLHGDAVSCYYTSKEIRLLIHTDLKQAEDRILDDLEKNIQEDMVKAAGGDRISKNRIGNNLIKYRKYIREVLGKYGYLMTKKEDSSKLY